MYLSTEQLEFTSLTRPLHRTTVRSILEKGSGALNEDTLLEDGPLFGVFDGATSLNTCHYLNGLTGGLLAATTAAQAFRNSAIPLFQCAHLANRRIREMQLRYGANLQQRHTLWSTSLAVVRLNGNQLEYCQTGDASIVFVFENGAHKVLTSDIDIDRETLHIWKKMQVEPGACIQQVLADQIRKVRLEMNVSYGVLNGEPKAMEFIRHGLEDITGVTDILLLTDGLQIPKEDPLEEHDWQTFVATYRNGGLNAVRDHVRHLQLSDPECRKYPRFKNHDDIAAVSISR